MFSLPPSPYAAGMDVMEESLRAQAQDAARELGLVHELEAENRKEKRNLRTEEVEDKARQESGEKREKKSEESPEEWWRERMREVEEEEEEVEEEEADEDELPPEERMKREMLR